MKWMNEKKGGKKEKQIDYRPQVITLSLHQSQAMWGREYAGTESLQLKSKHFHCLQKFKAHGKITIGGWENPRESHSPCLWEKQIKHQSWRKVPMLWVDSESLWVPRPAPLTNTLPAPTGETVSRLWSNPHPPQETHGLKVFQARGRQCRLLGPGKW